MLCHGRIEPQFNTAGQLMGAMICPMVQYSARLLAAMQAAGHTTASLHKALGVSYQAVKKAVEGGKFGTANHLKAAKVLGVSSDWLATGHGDMHAQLDRGAETVHVDRSVSYTLFDDRLLTREQIMSMGELPARFVFALEDDAMGDFGRAGTQVVFESASEARPGAGVLVRDRDGQLSVRRKAQGRSQAHWLAVAPNGVYRSLDSEADGLELLAVWRGVVNRGLEDA